MPIVRFGSADCRTVATHIITAFAERSLPSVRLSTLTFERIGLWPAYLASAYWQH